MTPDDSPPCGHGDTHPSDCAPWIDWTSALLRAERARRDALSAERDPTTPMTAEDVDRLFALLDAERARYAALVEAAIGLATAALRATLAAAAAGTEEAQS